MGQSAVNPDDSYLRTLSSDLIWQEFLDSLAAETDPNRRSDLANTFASDNGRHYPLPLREVLRRMLVVTREHGYYLGLAQTLANLGWNHLDGDDYQSARSFLLEGLELGRELSNSTIIMRCLNGLGACYTDMGLFERAIIHYRDALEVADQGRLVEHHGLILTNLARCHIDLGQYPQARQCLEQVVETSDSQPINRAIRLHHLALVNRYQNRLAEAETQLGQALILAEPYPRLVAQCRVELAWVLHADGREVQAEALIDSVVGDCGLEQDERGQAEAALARAAIMEATHRDREAQALLEKALALADQLGAGILRVQACHRLSAHFDRLRDYHQALRYSERSRILELALSRESNAQLIAGFEEEKNRREAQLYREQYSQMLAIGEIGRLITSSLELERIVATIHANLHRLMPVDSLLIGVYEPATHTLHFRSNLTDGQALPDYRLSVDDPNLATRCFQKQTPILINNLSSEYERFPTEELARSWSFPMAGLLFVPLQHGDRTIGVLGVQCRQAGVYTAHHLNTLSALASYVAIALENASLYEQLNILASKDVLTGFLNRRRFSELAADELRRAIRYYESLTFMMIDLDHFKQVNDKYGHSSGDQVLRDCADLIRTILRDSDAVCRWGGEEFALLLPHTDLEGGRLLAERIRQALAEHEVMVSDCQNIQVTASFGLAQWQSPEPDFESILRRADQALYRAKAEGRNRICLDQSPVSQEPPATTSC